MAVSKEGEKPKDGRGGARPGAGRKPTTVKHMTAVAHAEKKLSDALPALADKMIELAKGGDRQAVEYCLNRIMGKPTERLEHTGQDGGSIDIKHDFEALRSLPPDELIRIHRETLGSPGEDR